MGVPCCTRTAAENSAYSVLLLGPDGAGKTTLIARMTKDPTVRSEKIAPTKGMVSHSISIHGYVVQFYDTAGVEDLTEKWSLHFGNCQGFIYAIDSTDRRKCVNTLQELKKTLQHPDVKDKPVLIVATKMDKDGALREDVIFNVYDLDELLEEHRNAKYSYSALPMGRVSEVSNKGNTLNESQNANPRGDANSWPSTSSWRHVKPCCDHRSPRTMPTTPFTLMKNPDRARWKICKMRLSPSSILSEKKLVVGAGSNYGNNTPKCHAAFGNTNNNNETKEAEGKDGNRVNHENVVDPRPATMTGVAGNLTRNNAPEKEKATSFFRDTFSSIESHGDFSHAPSQGIGDYDREEESMTFKRGTLWLLEQIESNKRAIDGRIAHYMSNNGNKVRKSTKSWTRIQKNWEKSQKGSRKSVDEREAEEEHEEMEEITDMIRRNTIKASDSAEKLKIALDGNRNQGTRENFGTCETTFPRYFPHLRKHSELMSGRLAMGEIVKNKRGIRFRESLAEE